MSEVTEILRTRWLPRFWDEVVLSDDPAKVVNEYSEQIETQLVDDEVIRKLVSSYITGAVSEEDVADAREFLSSFHEYANTFQSVWGLDASVRQPSLHADGHFGEQIRGANERLLSHHAQKYLGNLVKESATRRKRTNVTELEFMKTEVEEFESLFRASVAFDGSYILDLLYMEEAEVELLRDMRISFVQGETKSELYKLDSDRIMALGKLTAIREYLDKLRSEITKQEAQSSTQTHPDYRYKLPIRKVGTDGAERSNRQLVMDIKTAWNILSQGNFIDCPADTFVSIFHPDEPLIPGARWISTKKELRYFISNLLGKTFRAKVKKRMQDVQAFGHDSIFRDEVPSSSLPKEQVHKCFLDEDGEPMKKKSFVNDGVAEPKAGTAEWTKIHSRRNILNQAAQALRGA